MTKYSGEVQQGDGYRFRRALHKSAPIECDSCGPMELIEFNDRCFEVRTDAGRTMKLCQRCGLKYLPPKSHVRHE